MTAPLSTHILPSQNSWHLKSGSVHHFICQCGEVDQYQETMVSHFYHPPHQCSSCGNRHYLDKIKQRHPLEHRMVTGVIKQFITACGPALKYLHHQGAFAYASSAVDACDLRLTGK